MDRSIGRLLAAAGTLGLALAVAASASALSIHKPGKKKAPIVAANEGSWIVHAGATRDIYSNQSKDSMPMQAYVCTQGPGMVLPHVELQIIGRAPIDIQGCDSVYLVLSPGERLSILNPNPADVSGSYKLDLQDGKSG